MCPLAPAPAPIYLPWPWQAPWNWLGFAAYVAFVCWGVFVRQPRRWFANNPSQLQTILSILGVISLASAFTLIVVVIPSAQQTNAWYNTQLARFSRQDCSLGSLFAIDSQNMNATEVWIIAIGCLNLLFTLMSSLAKRHYRVPNAVEVLHP